MGCVCSKDLIDIDNKRFLHQKRLAEGGFSVIDLVEETRTGKFYVLKRIQCHSKEDEAVADEEIGLYRAFDHPNIIKMYTHAVLRTSRDINEVLIVLPFYRRGTLQDELDRMKKQHNFIPEDRVLKLFHGVCLAVKAMHAHKPNPVSHKDIKPANVLISEDDKPILMDLGSGGQARVSIDSRSDAIAMQDHAAEKCSMLYRAPELFQVETNTEITESVDIWSLGCLIYSLMFYESPYEDAYQKGDSIALAAMGGHIKFPQDHSYSPELVRIVTSLMVVNPSNRPDIEQVLTLVEQISMPVDNRV